jgi:hypothetical protein
MEQTNMSQMKQTNDLINSPHRYIKPIPWNNHMRQGKQA